MASHRQAQSTKQTNETAHQRRTVKSTHQGLVALMEHADKGVLQRAIANPGLAAPDAVLALQQAYGNRAVSPLLTQVSSPRVQTKLRINPVGDRYEQEADRVAAQVMRQINAPAPQQPGRSQAVQRQAELPEEELQMKPLVQRQELPEEELQMKPLVQRQEPEEELQMQPLVQRQQGEGGMAATPEMEAAIQQARGSGRSLSDDVRGPMEKAFGADLGGVRVHADSKADALSQSLQARAFTTGRDIFFKSFGFQ